MRFVNSLNGSVSLIILPKYLYRGDSDKDNKRHIRATINHGIMQTNLSDKGKGSEIFQKPLFELINKHVFIGWKETHFLSFTTEERVAFYYASGGTPYCPSYYDNDWDFAVFTLDTSRFISNCIEQVELGIYKVMYIPESIEFRPYCEVLLIDVVKYLKNIHKTAGDNLLKAISNADRDKEWLVLPIAKMRDSNEYTSKLDTGCIAEKEVYSTIVEI